jgi:outer membrane protein OmpA-like peptidoglycan-associated protein
MERARGFFKAWEDSSVPRRLSFFVLFILCALTAKAQTREGRWMLGVQGGGHIMLNDFDTKKFGWGGEALLRYGLSEQFSLGFLTGYNEIKTENSFLLPNIKYSYLKMHAIPAALMGYLYFTPTEDMTPYLYVGAGVVTMKKRDGLGNYIPNSDWQAYSVFPAGVGVEILLNSQTTIGIDLGIRVFGSDNIERQETQAERDWPDAYPTARVGFDFYFGKGKEAEVEARPPVITPAPAPVAQPVVPAPPETAKVLPKPPAPELPKEEAVPKAPVPVVPKERALALEKGKAFILEGVNFELNSSYLTKEAKRTLEKAFRALRVNPDVQVKIVGHTDNIGSKKYNDWISLRRANRVKSWLVSKGISATRITTAGVGFSEPIAPNNTPEGRAKNRRIEFHVEE